MKSKIKTYAFFIIFTLAVGGLSALFTMGNMDIYDTINKPPFAPPSIVFPIVWGILYVLMAVGASNVYITGKSEGIYIFPAMSIYFIQLFVNFFWSIIFFNMQNFLFAFIWLLLLLVLVFVMSLRFYRVSKLSGLLQLPYIVWIILAGILNYAVFVLNIQ